MKFTYNLLNSMGLDSRSRQVVWAAHCLKAATVSSPKINISPAVPAVVAKAAILAKPGYPARAASAFIPASPSNPAIAAGALFLNSPAIAAGAAVPAFPAKSATSPIAAQDEVLAVPAIPAVVAPEIKALPGWHDAITFLKTPELIEIIAYLPYATSPSLIGAEFRLEMIKEITPSTLIADNWIDSDRGGKDLSLNNLGVTIEQYLYFAGMLCFENCIITDVVKTVNGVNLPCKRLVISIPALDYEPNNPALQLSKIQQVNANYGG